jgi:hypothetical protein
MKNRNGSYKKVLLSPEHLESVLPFLKQNVANLIALNLPQAELCSLYILLFLRVRHPRNWLQKKSKAISSVSASMILDLIPDSFQLNDWEKEKLAGLTCESLFLNFNLKGIPLSVNRSMVEWLRGNWDIRLLTHIPTPFELLNYQVNKARCLTITTDPDELASLVLSARDPLSFVLHDLMHADQFFHHFEIIDGQLGFYEMVNRVYEKPELKAAMKKDKQFKREFEYVASDMNAYVIHLFKCLKSAVIKFDQTLFLSLLDWWQMPELCLSASHRLNTPAFTSDDELVLKEFFEREKRI